MIFIWYSGWMAEIQTIFCILFDDRSCVFMIIANFNVDCNKSKNNDFNIDDVHCSG